MPNNLGKMPILPKLLALCERLYADSADFLDQLENSQLWYDRGYANGMLKTFVELGYDRLLPVGLIIDTEETLSPSRLLPWGKAYQHGVEQGYSEALDALKTAASAPY